MKRIFLKICLAGLIVSFSQCAVKYTQTDRFVQNPHVVDIEKDSLPTELFNPVSFEKQIQVSYDSTKTEQENVYHYYDVFFEDMARPYQNKKYQKINNLAHQMWYKNEHVYFISSSFADGFVLPNGKQMFLNKNLFSVKCLDKDSVEIGLDQKAYEKTKDEIVFKRTYSVRVAETKFHEIRHIFVNQDIKLKGISRWAFIECNAYINELLTINPYKELSTEIISNYLIDRLGSKAYWYIGNREKAVERYVNNPSVQAFIQRNNNVFSEYKGHLYKFNILI